MHRAAPHTVKVGTLADNARAIRRRAARTARAHPGASKLREMRPSHPTGSIGRPPWQPAGCSKSGRNGVSTVIASRRVAVIRRSSGDTRLMEEASSVGTERLVQPRSRDGSLNCLPPSPDARPKGGTDMPCDRLTMSVGRQVDSARAPVCMTLNAVVRSGGADGGSGCPRESVL